MKRFFNEKEVTSTLVMDALVSGVKQIEECSRLGESKKASPLSFATGRIRAVCLNLAMCNAALPRQYAIPRAVDLQCTMTHHPNRTSARLDWI